MGVEETVPCLALAKRKNMRHWCMHDTVSYTVHFILLHRHGEQGVYQENSCLFCILTSVYIFCQKVINSINSYISLKRDIRIVNIQLIIMFFMLIQIMHKLVLTSITTVIFINTRWHVMSLLVTDTGIHTSADLVASWFSLFPWFPWWWY